MTWKAGYVAGALAVLVPSAAMAQVSLDRETRGLYLGAGAGVDWYNDADIDGGGELEFDNPGWAANVFTGYDFGWPRLELELDWRNNNPENLGGAINQYAAMVNLLVDISIAGFPVTPYLGIGGGYAYIDPTQNDSDWGFAYQGIAGVSYDVTPNISLFADYRYFATEDVDIDIDVENTHHTVLAGLRYTFGAPPAPPPTPTATPPAPPPAPPPRRAEPPPPPPVVRSYLVFFDFDRANLTPEAERIVETAARNATTAEVTRINVTGHADRSGPAAYNQRLSMRRADAVKAELVQNGIQPNEIAVFAKGETDPLVPTPDGVREPQNRRVEIVFQ